jgi:L-ascorbate metabolism protein UlaG (beta-lactamase superfamily)
MTRSSHPRADASSDVPGREALRVTYVGHATVLIEIAGIRILTDPFLRSTLGPLQRHGPAPDAEALEVDAVVISHGHRDHFDRPSLESLPGSPTIVVPRGLAAALAQRGKPRGARSRAVLELAAGDAIAIDETTIRAVGARHWISPGAPKAQPVGYVIESPAPGLRVYFAGDTGPFAGMADEVGRVDLALLPVWTWGPHLGPGHLGPRSAADVARELGAGTAVPIHWGTLYPRQLHRVWNRALRDPGDRFARHARSIAPDVDVRVLRPGEATTIDPRRV